MARKELAGLAALGALALMANRGKKEVPDMRGGAEDERPAPTGMGEATQLLTDRNENYGNEGRRTGPVGIGMAPPKPRIKPPAVTSSASPAAQSASNQDWNKVSPEEADRRKKMESAQALEAVRPEEAIIGSGFTGLKGVAAVAKGLANRKGAAKLSEYLTPEIGMSRPMLPRPGQTYGEGFVMNRKKGGAVKMAKGGMTRSSASSRGDGIASKGKTRGRLR